MKNLAYLPGRGASNGMKPFSSSNRKFRLKPLHKEKK
jgi:hypothetical protein